MAIPCHHWFGPIIDSGLPQIQAQYWFYAFQRIQAQYWFYACGHLKPAIDFRPISNLHLWLIFYLPLISGLTIGTFQAYPLEGPAKAEYPLYEQSLYGASQALRQQEQK